MWNVSAPTASWAHLTSPGPGWTWKRKGRMAADGSFRRTIFPLSKAKKIFKEIYLPLPILTQLVSPPAQGTFCKQEDTSLLQRAPLGMGTWSTIKAGILCKAFLCPSIRRRRMTRPLALGNPSRNEPGWLLSSQPKICTARFTVFLFFLISIKGKTIPAWKHFFALFLLEATQPDLRLSSKALWHLVSRRKHPLLDIRVFINISAFFWSFCLFFPICL